MENKDEDLRMLYQVSSQDLVFFKQQQWSVTNYVLLLYVGIFGLTQIHDSICLGLIMSLIASIAGIFGVIIIKKLEGSINCRRDRLKSIRGFLSKEFNTAWESGNKDKDSTYIAWLLAIAIAIGIPTIWWFLFICRIICK